jgi:hypothetical protein
VTDDGFIVPCIDMTLRHKLFEQASKLGLSKQRQIECMGRCCAEMALQLVGGPLRFTPKNNHQKPSVLVLAYPGDLQGVEALCTARLLAIRSVTVYLYIPQNSSNLVSIFSLLFKSFSIRFIIIISICFCFWVLLHYLFRIMNNFINPYFLVKEFFNKKLSLKNSITI